MTAQARSLRAVWVLCVIWAVGAVEARGQALTSLEFSFSNPGARSLGFGGAFVALADDATAAFANPAGLIQIAEPEISIEGRSWHYSIPYTSGGRAAGEPSGWGIDTVALPLRDESSARLEGLSYFSYVYPHKRWSLAVYRHQLTNFEFGLRTQGLFGPGSGVSGHARTPIQTSEVDLEIVTWGLAAGVRASDRLSFGLGLSRFHPDFFIGGWDYFPDEPTLPSYFSRASFLPERLVQTVALVGDTPEWGLTAGVLWRTSERWNLGALYRQGADFETLMNIEAGPAHPFYPLGHLLLDDFQWAYSIPDVYGLGAAYRTRNGRWTGAFEWRRVEYSAFLESFPAQIRDPGDALDDADELHVGGEYAFFAGTSVVAVRLGLWHDPDHAIRSEANPAEEPFITAILPPGEDELHWTAGFGVTLGKIQVDLGIDLSERIDTASLSAIYGL